MRNTEVIKMKCDFCGSDLNEDDTYCPSCGSIQLTIKILNARAKKIMVGSVVIGLICIVIGVIIFLFLMDMYSDALYARGPDRISSKGDAWDYLVFINYPMFALTFLGVIGFNVMLIGCFIYHLYSRKEV
jgi:hypothetical protein